MTLFAFMSLYNDQKGECKICGTALATKGIDLRQGAKRLSNEPCVDHCHATGKVRGLLCFHCNTALGHVFDSPEILNKMIGYLATNNDTKTHIEVPC